MWLTTKNTSELKMNIFRVLPSTFIYYLLCCVVVCKGSDGIYDLSPLTGVYSVMDDANPGHRYDISFNGPLKYETAAEKEACSNSSVCVTYNGTALNLGNYSQTPVMKPNAINNDGFMMYFTSNTSCGSKSFTTSIIRFVCGKHLGSPVLTSFDPCRVYLFWESSVACNNSSNQAKEVRCYRYNEDGKKIDLSPLIKKIGGYDVESADPNIKFKINVCSNMITDNTTTCPDGVASCMINGTNAISFGSVSGGLQPMEKGVMIEYELGEVAHSCNRKTYIYFRCPNRTKSTSPKIVQWNDCNYQIVWETEHACTEDVITTNLTTCKFTEDVHGVNLDLSPLRKESGFYNVTAPSNGNESSKEFYLNVCGMLSDTPCVTRTGAKYISVCMFDSETNSSTVIGTKFDFDFRYADGVLSLKHKGLKASKDTVINFICSKDESDPQYAYSDEYEYVFEWRTEHACVKKKKSIPCFAMKEGKRIDLSRLQHNKNSSWLVSDERMEKDAVMSAFFIDVCEENTVGCPSGSSFCKRGAKQEIVSLGKFESPPYYDSVSDSVVLEYQNGDRCLNNLNWKSIIYFICKPGHPQATPILTNVNAAECTYVIEWHTAEACPMEVLKGSDCKIYNPGLGIDLDFTPLKTSVHVIKDGQKEFHIRVCGAATAMPCLKLEGGMNASACLFDNSTGTPSAAIIGDVNDTLIYRNGVVSLEYVHQTITTSVLLMCDHNAGHGEPVLTLSEQGNYVFQWFTDLACQEQLSVDCTALDPSTNEVYDLSGLSRTDQNWVIYEHDSGKMTKSYLNLCRPLIPQANCSRNAAVCIVDEKDGKDLMLVPNAGTVSRGPQLISKGNLQLVYTHGAPCTSYGESTNLSTVIHFMCQKAPTGAIEHQPKYLGKIGECQHTFLWTTKAACPTGDVVVRDSCYLRDPVTGFPMDISSLANGGKPYKFSDGNKTYEMNICTSVKEGCFNDKNKVAAEGIAVCEVDKDGKYVSTVVSNSASVLFYSKGQDLQLIYKSKNASTPDVSVITRFPCTTTNDSLQPKFVRKEGNTLILEMKTSLTCQMETFSCIFVDRFGREFDLTPLSGEHNLDWIAIDDRRDARQFRYHISFCKPLNRNGSHCAGGTISACKVDTLDKSHKGISLGSQYAHPTVNDDGVLRMSFINGEPCRGDIKSSATVDLICSPRQGALMFIGVTLQCEHIFSLETPFACPLKVTSGSECTVQEPMFGYTFDLKPLKPAEVTVDNYTYSLSVCEELPNTFGECNGAAACQTKSSDAKFAKSLGLPNSQLSYDQGVITLEYESGSGNCHQKYNRSTTIKFTCDHEANESLSQPQFVSEDEDCSYMFVWPTRHACPTFETMECFVQDSDGNTFDLSPLAIPDGNYYVRHPMSQNKTFVINVCRSVVHTKDSLCPYSAASCVLDSNATDPLARAVNLGQAQMAPYIMSNGKLQMKYTFGAPCKNRGSLAFYSTVIDFICDKSAGSSQPEFIGEDDCNYYFDWATAYACTWEDPVVSGNCTVSDPHTGFVYDFASLNKNTSYEVPTKDHLFKLNICGAVTDSACDKGMTGVCQEEVGGSKRHWSGGKPNAELRLSGNTLILNYSTGASCHGGKYERSSIIKFRCGSDVGHPVFEYETYDCNYFFSWKTKLACHPLIHCAVKNGSDHYDLSLFTRQPYMVAESTLWNDTATYYISVCGPLGRIPGVYCPPFSSVCRVTKDGLAQSLGQVEFPPFVDFNGHATSLYTNGSICTTGPNERMRSRIIFVCDPTEPLGEPKLVEYDPDICYYLFEWRSSIVCPEKQSEEKESGPCIYKDIGRGIYFDLSSARKPGSYYEVHGIQNNGTYLLNVCEDVKSSNLTKCADSGICFQSSDDKEVQNYGLSSSQQFRYTENRLMLSVENGDDCVYGVGGKRSAEIVFVCNPNAGVGRPTLHKEYACLVVFIWETSTVCRNIQHQCAFNLDGDYYDFYLLSSLSHNWNITDQGNTYWLNLCRGIRQDEQTAGCPPSAAVCMKSNGSHMPLGMVYSVKIKKQNYSSLLLTYESPSSQPCRSVNTSLTATTRIILQCGTSLGYPKIISGPDSSCYYDFLWKTSVACKENVEEVFLDDKGSLFEKELNYSMDLSPILNRTFNVSGSSATTDYFYLINLGGIRANTASSQKTCNNAAICQTHGGKDPFQRDIGTVSTRKFFRRGSELHLNFTSLERSCGKSKNRNVTTLFILVCSTTANAIGEPVFLYESGGCDYIFEWGTYVVCTDFHRPDKPDGTVDKHTTDNTSSTSSSHKAAIVISLLLVACIVCYVIFIVSKDERRAAAASKFRSCFSRVSVPRFRYKRWPERVSLVEDMQSKNLYEIDEDENILL